ncbi:hypothetical protein [Oceanobacter mangrovi]|uniref:hypothetical protein n=1 Tax=Oceanobacter mangrovi TaxID=2862510 RepID=UPI001C8D56DB|nr:hypothetical protein [Oceanobacter mangrovi]
MSEQQWFMEEELWVIWNGTLGIVDTVTIAEFQLTDDGHVAWLDEPYDMVGPFQLDRLLAAGQLGFEACTIMSRVFWQANQVELRRAALHQRREYQQRMEAEFARYQQRQNSAWGGHGGDFQPQLERQYRQLLDLPTEGLLEKLQIKTAFRRLAQKAHPDQGGSQELFVQITQARDALLAALG